MRIELVVMKQLSVYLDSNILIALCDGHDHDLRVCVEGTAAIGTHTYPFSADQVSEITASEHSDQNEKRLGYLERLSRCSYFVHSVTEFGFRSESPRAVHATINEVTIYPHENKLFANFISHDQQRQAREAFGLDPNQLNHLNGPQAVAEINAALSRNALAENATAPKSLSELIALSVLDFFGYWPDDPRTDKKGSRFPDSRHAFNASYFDVLVSNDKRMRNRAQAKLSASRSRIPSKNGT